MKATFQEKLSAMVAKEIAGADPEKMGEILENLSRALGFTVSKASFALFMREVKSSK